MDRRTFFRWAAGLLAALSTAGAGYGIAEAACVTVIRLPAAFAGITVALLSDLHHGPLVSRGFVAGVVDLTNALHPDLVALPGDFTENGEPTQVAACFAELARLSAPLGVFAVPGNHDHESPIRYTRDALTAAGLRDLTNAGDWLERSGGRLRIGGVDWGRQDWKAALGDAGPDDCCLALCHHPDHAEMLADDRVALMLSGHLHGGQVCRAMATSGHRLATDASTSPAWSGPRGRGFSCRAGWG